MNFLFSRHILFSRTFQENYKFKYMYFSSLCKPYTVVVEDMVRTAGDWVLGIGIDICPPSTGMVATGNAKALS